MERSNSAEQRRQADRGQERAHGHHLTLNTDGQRHPRENTLAVVALVLGVVSLLTAFNQDLHLIGSVTGLAGLAVGLYDQYISATTAERWVIVPAIGASAVGFALGLANGGFAI